MKLDRRSFNRLLLSSGAGLVLPACVDETRYGPDDVERLESQYREEAERSGTGPDGPQHVQGYRGLAELPWFGIDGDGRLVCTVEDLPPAVDFHAHLGMSLLLAPEIDLQARTPRVVHLLDCDHQEESGEGCPLDLDVYINRNFTEADLSGLRRGAIAQAIWGSASAATHTIPNLLDEMDATGVDQAVIHPIKMGLPFGDDLTERWRAAIRASGSTDRLLAGCSVNPSDPEAVSELERHAEAGARIVKLHPAVQRFFPDSPEAMAIYEACQRLGIVVFFHGGRAGIEPGYTHQFTVMRNYEAAFRRYPELPFVLGHAGARDVADAIPLAQRYGNVWFGIHGQGVSKLREIIDRVGGDRLLFGTDWPFYHLAATLAKVLMVTEGRPDLRYAVLRGNADRILGRRATASRHDRAMPGGRRA